MPGQIYSECFKWKTSEIHDIEDLRKMYLTLTIDLAEGIGQDSDDNVDEKPLQAAA